MSHYWRGRLEVMALSEESAASLDVNQIEQALLRLQGVEGARVVTDPATGQIQEVHLLARGQRPPKQIARDVQTLLLTRWDYRLDHRRVSIARWEDEAAASGELPYLEVRRVQASLAPSEATLLVEVGNDAQRWSGRAQGAATPASLIRLTAAATLEALAGEFSRHHFRAYLREARSTLVAHRSAIVVLLDLVSPYGTLTLLGTSFVLQHELWAAAGATVAAVSRRLGIDRLAV